MRRRWSSRQPKKGSLGYVAYLLALIGGIVMIVLSLAALVGFAISIPFSSPIGGYFGMGIIGLILGVIAVIGSRRVTDLVWAIILLIIGFVGGGIGGLLVLIGGLLGLLSRFI